jgi:pimeloyl-ACP methyl ester carboxylesterase
VPYVEAGGIRLYYEERGEGPALLMIMGLSANLDWWDPGMLGRLAERLHVVTFDNRGAGRSDKPAGKYSIAGMAADAAGLLRHLDMEKAHVLGVSMGGMIAQQLALDHPGLVDRLVLCCTNCGGGEQVLATPEVYAVLGAPREGVSVEDVARASLPLLFPREFMGRNPRLMDDFVARYLRHPMPAHCFFAQLGAVARWGSYGRLPEIKAPTLVLTGDADILIPPENSSILAQRIPGARLAVYPGGGHGFFAQFPERVAEDILAFLAA